MGKKELTKDDVAKTVGAYAKKHDISEQAAKERLLMMGVSRYHALSKYQGPAKPKAAKKAPKPKAAKKATKKAAAKKASEAPA